VYLNLVDKVSLTSITIYDLLLQFSLETPISADTNAGAPFGYYEFTAKFSVKLQLIAAVQKASKAFPDSYELKNAANAVTSLPDISLTI
jgi:hypothetical protein